MADTMKALAFLGIGKVGLVERPIPTAGPGDAVVRTTKALICTSDVHTVAGLLPVPEGRLLGHESVGVVHEIGEGVTSVQVGDRVAVNAVTPDGTCDNCQAGYTSQCGGPLGGYRFTVQKDGNMAEYFHVNDADYNLAPIPEGLADEVAVYACDMLSTGLIGSRLPVDAIRAEDPATARKYFANIDKGLTNPITLARASYWRGRAEEAAGDAAAARAFYEASSRYPTAYYGQLSRAKLGIETRELRMPEPSAAAAASTDERVRAAEMLYAVGEKDMVKAFANDLGEECNDEAVMAALGDLTYRREDAVAMLQLGKNALGRGLAMDHYAFPVVGIPPHKQWEPAVEHGMIYSVARTESAFDQRDHSHADAVGLMQITPEAGKDTAKRFGVSYDWNRMKKDPVYNTQMGAGELSALLTEYKGSLIMTFAGYNAGRGRVRDWVKAYGDPRDPKVDPVDWVERIPFSETRNYVQRVMENLAVYRVRFDGSTSVAAKTDARIATKETNAAPMPATGPAQ